MINYMALGFNFMSLFGYLMGAANGERPASTIGMWLWFGVFAVWSIVMVVRGENK